jgi:hypothetical protein
VTHTTTVIKSFTLYHADCEALRVYTAANRMSASQVIRAALQEYLARHGTQQPPADDDEGLLPRGTA